MCDLPGPGECQSGAPDIVPRFLKAAGWLDAVEEQPAQCIAAVLQAVLEGVQGSCSVYSLFDLERGRIVTQSGCRLPETFRRAERSAGRICHAELLAAGKRLAVFPDLSRTIYADTDEDIRRHGLKAYIGAPICRSGRTIGSLAVYDDHVRPFDETQCNLLHAAARVISFVAGQQFLNQQLQSWKKDHGIFLSLSAKAIATRDASFLDYCLRTIGDRLSPEGVCISWFHPDTGFNAHQHYWKAGRILPVSALCSDLHRLRILHELIEDKRPHHCNETEPGIDADTRFFLRRHGISAFLLMPICRQQTVVGVCTLYTHSGARICGEANLDILTAVIGIIAQWKEARDIARELNESQALIYQLFQLSPTSIYQVDLNGGRFIKVNEEMCRSTGYSEEELLAMRPEDLLTPASRELLHQRLADLTAGRPLSGNVEFQIRTKNGNTEWGHFHIRHLRDGNKIWGANVVVHMITDQKHAFEELANYRRRLEVLVEERTMALLQTNLKLQAEVTRRTETAKELRMKSERLKELNTAMGVLLDKRKEDRLRSEENIRVNLVQLIEPYLDRLEYSGLNAEQKQLLEVIRMNINDVVGSPMPELSAKYYIFSPSELQVANLIRKGRTTKDMARLLNVSPRTIESYRSSIRKKLNLKNSKVNLKTYLSSKE